MEVKVAKIKRKPTKIVDNSVETYSIKDMIKILIVIVIIFCVFYFITTFLVEKATESTPNSEVVVDSSKITLSQLLSRNEEEYYVVATMASSYDSHYIETNYINIYNEYINEYKQNENNLKFYYVDLDSALNKKYLGEKLNLTNNLSELTLNDEALFKIKDSKIEKVYVGKNEILDKLSNL